MKNILELLEKSALNFPAKTFIGEEKSNISFSAFLDCVNKIGSFIAEYGIRRKPVAVLSEKNAQCLEMAFGAVAGGCFYTILDSKAPDARLNKILDTLEPEILLTDEENFHFAQQLDFSGKIISYNNAVSSEINSVLLSKIRSEQIDTDILYILFTSGSTGIPKGVVISHKAALSYTDWVTSEFGFDDKTIFGSQSPFYFSMSVTDIFSSIACASTLEIIPKVLFSFPVELISYLNKKDINTIYWVPTAITIVSNLETFEFIKPEKLKKVLFAGEVMHTKPLNYWIDNLPDDVEFANLFGPTETTDICTFYRINRKFDNTESIPIGKPCGNCGVFILDDNNKEADSGELYVRGSFLANGYYKDKEKTSSAFVQNPLNNCYDETVYKTGDIVKINSRGELEYISRRDSQIKHMGYRIELGEIEACLNSCESIKNCVCIYDKDDDLIVAVFEGRKSGAELLENLSKQTLPPYMRPNLFLKIKNIPLNPNGKIDRKAIYDFYRTTV
jgi:D-alanine--poly(phosphoribitol) ligase subunit 1